MIFKKNVKKLCCVAKNSICISIVCIIFFCSRHSLNSSSFINFFLNNVQNGYTLVSDRARRANVKHTKNLEWPMAPNCSKKSARRCQREIRICKVYREEYNYCYMFCCCWLPVQITQTSDVLCVVLHPVFADIHYNTTTTSILVILSICVYNKNFYYKFTQSLVKSLQIQVYTRVWTTSENFFVFLE